jgi:hypothetical protein
VAPSVALANIFRAGPLIWKLALAAVLIGSVVAFGANGANLKTLQQAAERLYLLHDSPWPRSAFIEVVGLEVQPKAIPGKPLPPPIPLVLNDRVAKVARGSSVSLKVRAALPPKAKVTPLQLSVHYRTTGARYERGVAQMDKHRDSDDWRNFWLDEKPFKNVLGTLEFDVVGYDHRVRGYRLEVVDSPSVVKTTLDVKYPSYIINEAIGGPRVDIDRPYLPSGTFIPEGAQTTVRFQTNKPLRQATIVLAGSDSQPQVIDLASAAEKTVFTYTVEKFAATSTLEVSLLDADNVATEEPFRVFLTLQPDSPPTVETSLAGIGHSVTPVVMLPISGKVSDDHGVEAGKDGKPVARFEIQVNDTGERRQIEFPLGKGGAIEQTVDFLELASQSDKPQRLQPKDKLYFSVTARDRYDLGDPHVGVGERYELDVVTPEELLAQLEVREIGLRRRFEQILDEMVQLRDSLLRVKTSLAGQSASAAPEDLRRDDDPDGNVLTPQQVAQRVAELRLLRLQRGSQQTQKSQQESLGVAAGFEAIRAELINNRVDTADRKERLKEQIADPLRLTCETLFPELDRRILALEKSLREAPADQPNASFTPAADAVLQQSDDTIAELEKVLQKMLDLETYNELLDLVRDLISDQEKVTERTKQERKRQALEDLK